MITFRRPAISLFTRTLWPTTTRSYVIPSSSFFAMDGREPTRPRPAGPSRQRGRKKAATRRANFHATSLQNLPSAAAAVANEPPSAPAPAQDESSDSPRFADLGKDNYIDPVLLKTITNDMRFDRMTPVQAATIFPLLTHRADVLAQAKTGTGKTIAFLLPAIQDIIARNPTRKGMQPGKDVSCLIITPTRELAMQIADEARALLQRHPQFKVCVAIGGTNKDTEARRILSGCDILIGTPGRLHDHLGDEMGSILAKMQNLKSLVLDEADRLLDMGFFDSIKRIIKCLPDKKTTNRQGILFSATIPDHVRKVAHLALSDDYTFISTITEGEAPTHERVPQQLVLVPEFSDLATAMVGSIRQEIDHVGSEAFKAIIFAPTAGLVDFYNEVLKHSSGLPHVWALHSRLTQSRRVRITEEFRKAKGGILVATDVVARGMDFPAVTNVFQVGLPFDKETYVHRLGRTARAGAEGRGTLILTDHEQYFPDRTISDIALDKREPDLSSHGEVMEIASSKLGFSNSPDEARAKIYQAWLGFYKGYMKPMGWTAPRLVQEANRLALRGLGAPEVPKLQKSTIGKMGLKGVPGIFIDPVSKQKQQQQQRIQTA